MKLNRFLILFMLCTIRIKPFLYRELFRPINKNSNVSFCSIHSRVIPADFYRLRELGYPLLPYKALWNFHFAFLTDEHQTALQSFSKISCNSHLVAHWLKVNFDYAHPYSRRRKFVHINMCWSLSYANVFSTNKFPRPIGLIDLLLACKISPYPRNCSFNGWYFIYFHDSNKFFKILWVLNRKSAIFFLLLCIKERDGGRNIASHNVTSFEKRMLQQFFRSIAIYITYQIYHQNLIIRKINLNLVFLLERMQSH